MKQSESSISAIIPVYNEEKTVGRVVKTVLDSKIFREVICINDGSIDRSLKILKSFGKKIILLHSDKNNGKSYAVSKGILKSREKIVVFIDSDLVGLKNEHLEKMINTFLKIKCDCLLADVVKNPNSVNLFRSHTILTKYDFLTGERIYYKKDLIPLIPKMKNIGYGLEVFLNNEFKNKKTKIIKLTGVEGIPNYEKISYEFALMQFFKGAFQISRELARQRGVSEKKITAFQKKIFQKHFRLNKRQKIKLKKSIEDFMKIVGINQ